MQKLNKAVYKYWIIFVSIFCFERRQLNLHHSLLFCRDYRIPLGTHLHINHHHFQPRLLLHRLQSRTLLHLLIPRHNHQRLTLMLSSLRVIMYHSLIFFLLMDLDPESVININHFQNLLLHLHQNLKFHHHHHLILQILPHCLNHQELRFEVMLWRLPPYNFKYFEYHSQSSPVFSNF